MLCPRMDLIPLYLKPKFTLSLFKLFFIRYLVRVGRKIANAWTTFSHMEKGPAGNDLRAFHKVLHQEGPALLTSLGTMFLIYGPMGDT